MRHALLATTLWLGVAGCVGREDPAGRGDGSGTATPATAPEAGRRVARKAGTMPKVGDVAPEFRVRDHTGKERTLAEFRGKRVVLWFFPKADTPG